MSGHQLYHNMFLMCMDGEGRPQGKAVWASFVMPCGRESFRVRCDNSVILSVCMNEGNIVLMNIDCFSQFILIRFSQV